MTLITSPVPLNNQPVAGQENAASNLLTDIVGALNGGLEKDNLTTVVQALVDPPIVTALPGSPYDGQRILFRPAAGILWPLRYDAAMSGTSKWESIGGGPPIESSPFSGPTGAGNNNLAPITVPLAGVYSVSADLLLDPADGDGAIAIRIGAVPNLVTLAYQYTRTPGTYIATPGTGVILAAGAQNLNLNRDVGGNVLRSSWTISPKYLG